MTELNLNMLDVSEADLCREMDHEENLIAMGKSRYEQRTAKELARGNGTASAGGKGILANMTAPLADIIVEEIARLESGGVKRKPPELRTLKLLPSRDMAVLAMRATLDTMASSPGDKCTAQRVGFRIGNAVSQETVARQFRRDERPLFDAVIRRVTKRTSSPTERAKALLTAYSSLAEEHQEPMDNTEKVRLGAFMLTCLEGLGIIRSITTKIGKKNNRVYEIAEGTLDIIKQTDAVAAEMRPYLLPTLIPPRPWSDLQSGGYWLPFRGNSMVIAKTRTNGIREAQDEDMPRMFTPVNYIQSVPFRINKGVFSVIEQMRKANITCSSLPASQLDAIPAKPHDMETNEEARKEWRRAARTVYTRNSAAKGRILGAEKVITVARDMHDEEAIYFPKVVDFRGRVYDQPMFLKPQGDDLSKGLLEFANGKALGEGGGYWLAVHGANVWGEDKVSFDQRVAWVAGNEVAILQAAENPFGNRFWMDADKPFQFLAFCFEWAGALEQGDAFVSHLPVALDGSCNGLQHLSAMLRDSVGGAAVNLLPAKKPQDIYTEVMNRVIVVLTERAEQGEPTAQKWLPIMKRNTVKRPVMTLPYGATRQGFADQIMEDSIAPLQKAGECPFTTEPYAAAQYLGKIVWEVTGEVVIAARVAMDWLQEVAKVVAKAGQGITWTTPSGFVVKQDYRKAKSREVELFTYGQRVRVRIAEGYVDKIDARKMSLAIAPNFVHSMDAAHMLRTVEALLDVVGPSIHLSMVHDSYATHACDAEALSYAIRQSFVEMYQEADWLESFREEIAAQLPEEIAALLPPVPAKGDLEITEVLTSLYFFA
jgi:DNA-directed RNA polymerase